MFLSSKDYGPLSKHYSSMPCVVSVSGLSHGQIGKVAINASKSKITLHFGDKLDETVKTG